MTDIARSIGALEEAIKHLTTTSLRAEDRAQADRILIYDRIGEIKADVSALNGRVDSISERLGVLAPSVKKFEEAQNREAGAKNLGQILWGVAISLITIVIAGMSQFLQLAKTATLPPPGH